MEYELRPYQSEIEFLNYSYNAFLDNYEEIREDSFWNNTPYYRLSKMRDVVLIYTEILEYEPIQWYIDALKKLRPPMEAELSKDYIEFIRNVLVHFPFYNTWDTVKLSKELINWSKPGKSIDRFLHKYSGHPEIKYRIWDKKKKAFTYVSVSFPPKYDSEIGIYLKDIMPEKEGFIFIISLMHSVMMSQVERIKLPNGV